MEDGDDPEDVGVEPGAVFADVLTSIGLSLPPQAASTSAAPSAIAPGREENGSFMMRAFQRRIAGAAWPTLR
jgi:hypothetical protein